MAVKAEWEEGRGRVSSSPSSLIPSSPTRMVDLSLPHPTAGSTPPTPSIPLRDRHPLHPSTPVRPHSSPFARIDSDEDDGGPIPEGRTGSDKTNRETEREREGDQEEGETYYDPTRRPTTAVPPEGRLGTSRRGCTC